MASTWAGQRSYTRIKLCEFESLDAAYEASFLGADLLGFHIFSDQDVWGKAEKFRYFFGYLPDGSRIGKTLLTDLDLEALRQLWSVVQFDSLQLYNPVTHAEIAQIRQIGGAEVKLFKVMSAQPQENPLEDAAFIDYYSGQVDALLLDSSLYGGSGVVSDWSHCAEIVRRSPLPVFLAGGLTADNVAQAIAQVRPFGVDVENGVSSRMPDGLRLKNLLKCRTFIERVREADGYLGRS